jgi:hypothetical protein
MTRLVVPAAFITLALVAVSHARPQDPDPRPKSLVPSIADIMDESHGCRTAYIKQVRTELGKDEPDWNLVEAKSRELIRTGKLLALNTPPTGSRESWERLTTIYTARATVLADAAERHDREEATVEANRMIRMCATCHKAHR